MPRRDRVDPIKLGGCEVEAVGDRDLSEQTVTEREPAPAIEWQKLFQLGEFDQEAVQFLMLTKVGGYGRDVVAERLGWEPKHLHSVEMRAYRQLKRLKQAVVALMDDFQGGSSRRLSFTRQLDSGAQFWNLRKLDAGFDAVLADERDYISEKKSIGKCENG